MDERIDQFLAENPDIKPMAALAIVELCGVHRSSDPIQKIKRAKSLLERWIKHLEVEQQKPSPDQAAKELADAAAALDSIIRKIVADDVDLQDYQAPEARPVANFIVTRDRAVEPGAD